MRSHLLKLLWCCGLFILGTGMNAQDEKADGFISKSPFSIGETVNLYSETLGEQRLVNIYLPHNYEKNTDKSYPVIYLLDGSADEDFIHVAGLVQFGSFSWINMIPETIVVGISNIDRKRDFTFPSNNKRDQTEFPTTGGAKKFIAFIENELIPLIETSYRIAEERTIIGQSLGGLLATEIAFKKPQLFHNYIIVSPSLWWDDESLLQESFSVKLAPKSIYIAVGKEGEVMERVAKELYQKLKGLSLPKTKLYFKFLEEQDHGDALHLAIYDAFEQLFRVKQK